MAWNEPGNNGKNNDPWKQGGRDQGPPDLDEVFRNLGKKFGGIRWLDQLWFLLLSLWRLLFHLLL